MEITLMNFNNKLIKHSLIFVLITIILLSIPLIAMQFTNEVKWTFFDFLVAGILLMGTGISFVLLANKAQNKTYKLAIGLTLGTALFMIWSNLAVGIIGDEDTPINILYLGVLGVGTIGSFISRFKPKGMSLTLILTAISQVIVIIIALFEGYGNTLNLLRELLLVNGFFIVLWLGAAYLFKKSSEERNEVRLNPTS